MKKACVLFSGGKDSALALYRASKNFKIEYILSIIPINKDSYMFHKPDLKLLKKQAQMLGINLILGKTKGEKEKEMSDLKNLVLKIKDKIDVIVIGGLASNYQCKKIEKLARELGLEVYSPLWGYDAYKLWGELLDKGFEVIITKIACEGIPQEYLGKPIDSVLLDDLKRLSRKYKFRLDFEGGEAETAVLNMPMFKKGIKINYTIVSEGEYRHFLNIKGVK
ncbi:MAG: diphthine--ammonia ligase [archaeon]